MSLSPFNKASVLSRWIFSNSIFETELLTAVNGSTIGVRLFFFFNILKIPTNLLALVLM